ncbi:MAG: ribonuclease HII [Patescibacteria group bacterium]
MNRKQSPSYLVGIDEVGRGPLAGPVTVAAVLVLRRFVPREPFRTPLRDSKRLSAVQRERWYKEIRRERRLAAAVSSVSARSIDRWNVTEAANRAAESAVRKLFRSFPREMRDASIFLDGGLFLKPRFLRSIGVRNGPVTLIRGDERVTAITLASIVAKVTRDRYMVRLGERYPAYGFAVHKGYGTPQHFRALRVRGRCPAHRLTFCRRGLRRHIGETKTQPRTSRA